MRCRVGSPSPIPPVRTEIMQLKWNRRTKLLAGYGFILAMTIVIAVTGLRTARALSNNVTEITEVRAPASSDAGQVERLMGIVQSRLETIVSAASRHEMQTIAEQTNDLTTRRGLMMGALDRLQQYPQSDVMKASFVKVRGLADEWWRQATVVE